MAMKAYEGGKLKRLKKLGSKDRHYGTLVAIVSIPSDVPGVAERYYFYVRGKNDVSMIPEFEKELS